MISLFLLCTVITLNSFFSYTQVPNDSILAKLNGLTGIERVDFINRISQKYLYNDIRLSQVLADEASLLSKQLSYSYGNGWALINRGKIAFLTGKTSQSIQLLDSALQIARDLEQVEWEVDIYRWLARSHEEINELDESISYYQLYFDHYRRTNDRTNMALALNWKGDIFHRLGRMWEARDQYQQALQYFKELNNQRGKFITLINLAMLELETGHRDIASNYFHLIDQISPRVEDQNLLLTYFQSKAVFYKQLNPDSSIFYMNHALRITDREGKPFTKLSILKKVSDWYVTLKEYDQADRFNQEYARLYDSLFRFSGKLPVGSIEDPLIRNDSLPLEPVQDSPSLNVDGAKRTLRGLIIIGIVFLLFSLFLFIRSLFQLKKWKIHLLAGTLEGNKNIEQKLEPGGFRIQPPPKNTNRVTPGRSFLRHQSFGAAEDPSYDKKTPDQIKSPDPQSLKVSIDDQKIDRILQSMGSPMLALDKNLKVKSANSALYELLLYRKDELNGIPINLLLKKNDRNNEKILKKTAEILVKEKREKDLLPIPVIFINKSGEYCHLDTVFSLYKQEAEFLILFLLFTRHPDFKMITDNPIDFNLSSEKLNGLIESLGLQKKEYLNFVFNQHLWGIYHNLIEDPAMMNINRSKFYLDDTSWISEREQVNLFTIYENIKHVLKDNIHQRIRFHEEIKNEFIHVLKKEWIYALFYIILKNAIESIRDSGDIYFLSRILKGQYVIKIIDTGEGIPIEYKEKVFKSFFTTRTDPSNQGLGLSVAREIMKRHLGGIKIRSNYAKGTEVILGFPVNLDK